MVIAKTGQFWARAKPVLKARCSAGYRRNATTGTISTFGLELFFDNGPEMRVKPTSSPATVGPSPKKVTFRRQIQGNFHAWTPHFREYFLHWPAHIRTLPRDNSWSGQFVPSHKFFTMSSYMTRMKIIFYLTYLYLTYWRQIVLSMVEVRCDVKESRSLFNAFISISENSHVKCLEKLPRNKLKQICKISIQLGFRHGHSITDQIFTLQPIFRKSWEYTKKVYTCYVDFEKAYDRVSRAKHWGVLRRVRCW